MSFQQQLRILAIRLLLAHSFRKYLRCVPDPQLKLQLAQQTLKPACVPAGFHSHSHSQTSLLERRGKTARLLAVQLAAVRRSSPVSVSTNAICWKPG